MPPELERARNWLRPRSVRSGSNPPQLMVPFAAPLAGFSGRSHDRALLGLRVPIRTTRTAATKLRMANHQICQISEKPMTVAKKAVMKPAGLGIAVSNLTDDLIDPLVRLLRLVDHPADIPVLAAAIEREIL